LNKGPLGWRFSVGCEVVPLPIFKDVGWVVLFLKVITDFADVAYEFESFGGGFF